MRFRLSSTLLIIAAGYAHAADVPAWPSVAYKHVLILTIDGIRESDVEDSRFAGDLPNIRALQAAGITFTSAISPAPADSFPGLLGIMTGALPKTTGVYFDESYTRALYEKDVTLDGSGNPVVASVAATIGAHASWTEAVTKNSAVLNGIATNPNSVPPLFATGYDATSIDPAKLPQTLTGSGASATLTRFFPHQYLKVNTIFEVAHAAGLRTAWADKHPSYEILNGPSGTGMDDFFGPESEAKIIATAPSNRISGTFTLVDGGSKKASKSQGGSLGQDDLRVQVILNQLAGRTSKGATASVPALFGMNFIAVNSAQKFDTTNGSQPDNSLSTGSQLNGGIDTDGTISANLHEAVAHTDASIGKIVTALKTTTDTDGRTLYDNTLIVVTSKHGNTPRLGKAVVLPVDWFSTTTSAQAASAFSATITYPGGVAPLAGIAVAQATEDAVALIWLGTPGADLATAVANLKAFAAANPTLVDTDSTPFGIAPTNSGIYSLADIPKLNAGMGNPATDDRAPDIIVKFKSGVIAASSLKRAEHGGFTVEETAVPLVFAGGLPSALRGTNQAATVSTTQIAPTALRALGLDAGALQGVRIENTQLLTSVLNRAPVAVADTLLAKTGTKLVIPSTVLSANDTDGDGDPLAVTAVSATTAAGGTAALVDGKVIYTPPTIGFSGNDSFTYTVRDGVCVSGKIPVGDFLAFGDVGHTLSIFRGGYGSALYPVPGSVGEYYALTDRGPNGDAAGTPAATDPNAKLFPKADFHPEIAHLKWNADGSVTVLGTITLATAAGVPLTGLPTHLNGSTVPVPSADQVIDVGYDLAGTALAVDPNGIDSEGLVALADGTFWVSDEYGPYLVHFDAMGKTVERINPLTTNAQGHKLPQVLARRLTNKGMEGLAVTPDGTLLVGMMQSALVNDPTNDPIGNPYVTGGTNTYGVNNKSNLMLRVVTYRLVAGTDSFRTGATTDAVGAVHQYAYLLGDPAATGVASNNTQAISELTAISNTDFLVDERDGKFSSDTPSASKPLVKKSWRFTLTGATPIDDGLNNVTDSVDGLKFSGSTLETLVFNKAGADAKTVLLANSITPLKKDSAPLVTILDKRTTGDFSLIGGAYSHDKVEGIVFANNRVVYSNDDDFALNGTVAKTITGSYTVGNQPFAATAGQINDYGQLLEVDPVKLQADIGIVTVIVSAAGNTPPTISDVTNKTTSIGVATSAIPVTIGDAETTLTALVLTASSSNTALIPASGIVLAGSGANRTVTITPAAGVTGSSTITLTVTDGGGLTASDTFVVTVQDVNTPPAPAVTDDSPAKCGAGSGIAGLLGLLGMLVLGFRQGMRRRQ